MDGGKGVQRYLEADIGSITMEKMIVLLYERMIRDLHEARDAVEQGDRVAMIESVSHAQRIITELSSALDHAVDGALAGNLHALYDYLFRENLSFLVDLDTVHVDNAIRVLKPLIEAWTRIPVGEALPPSTRTVETEVDPLADSGHDDHPCGAKGPSPLFSVSA